MARLIVTIVLYVLGIGFFRWLGGIQAAGAAIERWGHASADVAGAPRRPASDGAPSLLVDRGPLQASSETGCMRRARFTHACTQTPATSNASPTAIAISATLKATPPRTSGSGTPPVQAKPETSVASAPPAATPAPRATTPSGCAARARAAQPRPPPRAPARGTAAHAGSPLPRPHRARASQRARRAPAAHARRRRRFTQTPFGTSAATGCRSPVAPACSSKP